MKNILIHIGTHKTGTTSIQSFMAENYIQLKQRDVECFIGRFFNFNHVELHMSAMQKERQSPAKLMFKDQCFEQMYLETKSTISSFVNSSECNSLIFSAEGLSYLRYKDELSRLGEIFASYPVKIVIYLREKAKFLTSYKRQLERMGFEFSDNKLSFAYCKSDSWLIDYDSIVEAYKKQFGEKSVSVKYYDFEVAKSGSVLPSFIDEINCDLTELSSVDKYQLNSSKKS